SDLRARSGKGGRDCRGRHRPEIPRRRSLRRGGALSARDRSVMPAPRLMAVLAHPDDESLGIGGTLAKYASEGVEVFLLTATRGDAGRYRGHRQDDPEHPGAAALGK